MDPVELAIRMSADVSDVEAGFASAGDSALRMSDNVASASAGAEASAGRLDVAAESADNMASKSSQAAGGIGDLGGALALMPGPLGAVGAGMEAVSPAIMGVTGAADLANLALSSNVVQATRARAAAIAQAVASRTVAGATRVWAAGQWVLNAALSANPIGIVVVAIAALVAGIVLAYNKSETFRRIVDGAMRGARTAVTWVVDKVRDLVELVGGKAGDVWETMKSHATGAIDAVLRPIRTAIDLVEDLIGWISRIDFPDMPDWLGKVPGFGRAVPGFGRVADPVAAGAGTTIDARTYIDVDGSGLVDTSALIQLLADLLRRQGIRLGEIVPGATVIA